jgi:hypothetical protein
MERRTERPKNTKYVCLGGRRMQPRGFRTGRLGREQQMVQLSATRCSCIAILWNSLVSFAAITLCVASKRVMPKVSVYFIIDWVQKLFYTPSCGSSAYRPGAKRIKNSSYSTLSRRLIPSVAKVKSVYLTKYHAVKTYPLLHSAPHHEDALGEWTYSWINS